MLYVVRSACRCPWIAGKARRASIFAFFWPRIDGFGPWIAGPPTGDPWIPAVACPLRGRKALIWLFHRSTARRTVFQARRPDQRHRGNIETFYAQPRRTRRLRENESDHFRFDISANTLNSRRFPRGTPLATSREALRT